MRPACAAGVLPPLVGVDVAEIEHATRAGANWAPSRTAPSTTRTRTPRRAAAGRPALRDPAGQRAVAVVRQRERLAVQQARRAAQRAPARVAARDRQTSPQRSAARHVLPVGLVVDERAEMDACAAAQAHRRRCQRPDLVALVGRIRNPVREEQDSRSSEVSRDGGPSSCVTPSGSRRHSRIMRWYFGFVGLRFGSSLRFTRKYS